MSQLWNERRSAPLEQIKHKQDIVPWLITFFMYDATINNCNYRNWVLIEP